MRKYGFQSAHAFSPPQGSNRDRLQSTAGRFQNSDLLYERNLCWRTVYVCDRFALSGMSSGSGSWLRLGHPRRQARLRIRTVCSPAEVK